MYVVLNKTIKILNFKTAPYPNPEDITTFDLSILLAKEVNADIIMSSDPDADRLGLMVKDNNQEYVYLSGNKLGSILCYYILNNTKLTDNDLVIKSIVSTPLVNAICNNHNVLIQEVYTGCKNIAKKIEDTKEENKFVFGFEESLGYMIGTDVRDKNSFSSALLISEIGTMLKSENKTILDYLESIYNQYGYYYEDTISLVFKGITGDETIAKIMSDFRDNSIDKINDIRISEIYDYKLSIHKNLNDNITTIIDLDKSNVLKYVLEDNSWFIVRPSGTEPKIKFYFGVVDKDKNNAVNKLKTLISSVVDKYKN